MLWIDFLEGLWCCRGLCSQMLLKVLATWILWLENSQFSLICLNAIRRLASRTWNIFFLIHAYSCYINLFRFLLYVYTTVSWRYLRLIPTNLSQPPGQTSQKSIRQNMRKPVAVRWKGLSRGSGDTLCQVLRRIMVAKWRKCFSVVKRILLRRIDWYIAYVCFHQKLDCHNFKRNLVQFNIWINFAHFETQNFGMILDAEENDFPIRNYFSFSWSPRLRDFEESGLCHESGGKVTATCFEEVADFGIEVLFWSHIIADPRLTTNRPYDEVRCPAACCLCWEGQRGNVVHWHCDDNVPIRSCFWMLLDHILGGTAKTDKNVPRYPERWPKVFQDLKMYVQKAKCVTAVIWLGRTSNHSYHISVGIWFLL